MSISILKDATATIPSFTFAGSIHPAKVVSCYDGDTFEAVMFIGEKLWKFDCRMSGYDSPEIKPLKTVANRDSEKAAAVRAKTALLSFVCDGVDSLRTYANKELDELVKQNKKVIELHCKQFDKYGRILVDIPISESDTVNAWMVKNSYGYEYSGGTKKVWSV
jgi:endonuclease YncB( thermonuclease family)